MVSALFAAAMGAGQSSARRSLAYLLMSQSALLVVGGLESAGDPPGPWLLVQVAIAGFAMAIAGLEARRGPLSLDRPSGNFARLPRLATAFLVLGLAIAGFPGTIGYVAIEHLTGEAGSLSIALRMALLAATALNAIAVLRGFFMLFMGTAQHQGEQDTTRRESLVFSALMAAVVLAGVWPAITWLPSTLSSPWVGHPDFQRITDRPTR